MDGMLKPIVEFDSNGKYIKILDKNAKNMP
jgi:hypothetical protein